MVFLDLSTSLGHFKVFFGNLAYFAILIGFVLANKFFENHVLIVSSAMLFFGYVARAFNADDLQSLRNSLTEVYRELKRINWPSHAETLKFVGVVATFVAVSAIFWWIMDGLITRVLSFLLQLLS
jgi:preprotein translocase SecE subunit